MKIKWSSLSIKWKLTLALISSGFTLILAYALIAKDVFESDKIAYVYEIQGIRAQGMARELESELQRIFITVRSAVASFNPAKGGMDTSGEELIKEEKSILAFELLNEKVEQPVFRFEKSSGILPITKSEELTWNINQMGFISISENKFILFLRYLSNAEKEEQIFRLRVLFEKKDIFPIADLKQIFLLVQNEKVLLSSQPSLNYQSLIPLIKSDSINRTILWNEGKQKYLVSSSALGIEGLYIVAVTPESVALGALETLFTKSILFLLISTLLLIVVSLTLAKGLTLNLSKLTRGVENIGLGDFKSIPTIKSEDEMGILAKAMTAMGGEIERLLNETKDKIRMEQELKTAKLVQDALMPENPSFELGEIQVYGTLITSTECGGDWWYYFQKKDDVFVVIADATGHGTSAALLTAAARAVFSRLEKENLTLTEMMCAWDEAVKNCSRGKVFMTGLILKINCKTGKGYYVGAGHEDPILLRAKDSGFVNEVMVLEMNKVLGEGFSNKAEELPFSLYPGESLILFTDGLFSIKKADNKTFSENRLGKLLALRSEFGCSAKRMTELVFEVFDKFRENAPLPDDVSVVVIKRICSTNAEPQQVNSFQ